MNDPPCAAQFSSIQTALRKVRVRPTTRLFSEGTPGVALIETVPLTVGLNGDKGPVITASSCQARLVDPCLFFYASALLQAIDGLFPPLCIAHGALRII